MNWFRLPKQGASKNAERQSQRRKDNAKHRERKREPHTKQGPPKQKIGIVCLPLDTNNPPEKRHATHLTISTSEGSSVQAMEGCCCHQFATKWEPSSSKVAVPWASNPAKTNQKNLCTESTEVVAECKTHTCFERFCPMSRQVTLHSNLSRNTSCQQLDINLIQTLIER